MDSKYINPGSVGKPRESREHTCIYMVDNNIEQINLDNYDVIKTKKLIKKGE